MTVPASLAGCWWAEFAEVTVELGLIDSWTPGGSEWDGALWDVALWGESYLTPSGWVDVTADVESLDLDTGRNGVDDPGDVASARVLLDDRAGGYGIAGPTRSAIGNLLRVTVTASALDRSAIVFHGVVTDAGGQGDLLAPSTSLGAIDLLGALLGTDDTAPLPAQTVAQRLAMLCDLAGIPAELRDIAPDATTLIALDTAGSRLDAGEGGGGELDRGHAMGERGRGHHLPLGHVSRRPEHAGRLLDRDRARGGVSRPTRPGRKRGRRREPL